MKTFVALLAAVSFLSSCVASSGAPEPAQPLVLRSYDVPNDGAVQVRQVLKTLLWMGSDGKDSQKYVGRAEVGPDGRLVVMATEGVQGGVKSLIDALAKNPPKAPARYALSYWFVFAMPGKGAAPAANLGEVSEALAEIEKADGPMEFSLTEKVTVSSIGGESAYVEGHQVKVRQVVGESNGALNADLQLRKGGQNLETRVTLAPGQTIVLGSSGAMAPGKDGPVGSVYYLIRAASHDGRGK